MSSFQFCALMWMLSYVGGADCRSEFDRTFFVFKIIFCISTILSVCVMGVK